MIAIIDYGVGNLFSLASSLSYLGLDNIVTGDMTAIKNADRIILPGVGAFGDAAAMLEETGLGDLVCEEAGKGKLILGICLGMQLLFDKSFEYGEHNGLSLIPGSIIALKDDVKNLFIPHIGWNSLCIKRQHPVLKYFNDGDCVYYVHSYYLPEGECTVAQSEYGTSITGIATKDNVLGMQFHPEKSGKAGLALLKAFAEIKG